MASWDAVRRIALTLPETSERLSRNLVTWQVRKKAFVWERPLRKADLRALGEQAPEAPKRLAREYLEDAEGPGLDHDRR